MDKNDDRDTHFQGWARQVWHRMSEEECLVDPMSNDRQVQDVVTLLAQAGYDLVSSALGTETVQWEPLEAIGMKDILDLITPFAIPSAELGELRDMNSHGHESREEAYRKRFGI